MFGYSYSGFLTVQKAVDEFILSQAAGQRVYLNVSMGLFPEKVGCVVGLHVLTGVSCRKRVSGFEVLVCTLRLRYIVYVYSFFPHDLD